MSSQSQIGKGSSPIAGPARDHASRFRRFVRATFRIFLGGVGTLAVLGAFFWWLQAHNAKAHANPTAARRHGLPMPVRTDRVIEKTYSRTFGATGVTSGSQSAIIHLGAGAAGTDRHLVVKNIPVQEGQSVKQGDVLIEFDDTACRLTCEQRKRACEIAEAEYKAVADLRERGAASLYQAEQARGEYELALLDWKIAQHDLETCIIRSPIDGFVEKFEAIPGEQVDLVLEITQVHCLDPIHFRVDLPQEQIAQVEKGIDANVVLDSFPQEVFTGKVIAVGPEVDEETRVLPVVIEIPNPDHRIKAGVDGFARFHAEKKGVLVPATAVIQMDTKAMAFVVEGDRARMRPVRTGSLVEEGMREVLEGLRPGDEVVIYGQQDLNDNDKVNPDWRKWARR